MKSGAVKATAECPEALTTQPHLPAASHLCSNDEIPNAESALGNVDKVICNVAGRGNCL